MCVVWIMFRSVYVLRSCMFTRSCLTPSPKNESARTRSLNTNQLLEIYPSSKSGFNKFEHFRRTPWAWSSLFWGIAWVSPKYCAYNGKVQRALETLEAGDKDSPTPWLLVTPAIEAARCKEAVAIPRRGIVTLHGSNYSN